MGFYEITDAVEHREVGFCDVEVGFAVDNTFGSNGWGVPDQKDFHVEGCVAEKKAPFLWRETEPVCLLDGYGDDFIAFTYVVNQIYIADDFAEYGVPAVQVLGVLPVMAHEEL